jgi:hypothetical protein
MSVNKRYQHIRLIESHGLTFTKFPRHVTRFHCKASIKTMLQMNIYSLGAEHRREETRVLWRSNILGKGINS